jgi:hypothetical protein
MNTQSVANKLKKNFNFLIKEYDFKTVSSVIENDFCSIKMQNYTTGISLNYERREDDVLVYLYRLIDGQMIEDKIPISVDIPLNSIELRYIIQFKKGDDMIGTLQSQNYNSIDGLIQNIVNDLKEYASDILKGNFDVFSKVDAVAKKRRLEWQNS